MRLTGLLTTAAILAACSGGESGGSPQPPAPDALPSAVIDAPDNAFEQRQLTVSAANSTDAEGAIASYFWMLDDDLGGVLQLSATSGASIDVTIGELPSDAVFELTVIVTDSAGQRDAETVSIPIVTVEGRDDNNDSVRDDIEAIIADAFAGAPEEQAILREYAALFQDQIEADASDLASFDQFAVVFPANCLDEISEDADAEIAQVSAEILNTEQRAEAYFAYERFFQMTELDFPDQAALDAYCDANF